MSQTPVEQAHIASAVVFELSKVETVGIRQRVVSHLLNIDENLAVRVAKELRLPETPAPATPARVPIADLKPSPPLSIVKNGPQSFKGRKLGIVVTDGVDTKLFEAVTKAAAAVEASYEVVAPQVGGVTSSSGGHIEGKERIDGGPSVLYDAVVLLCSEKGVNELLSMPAARDFVADAHAHCKFVGYVSSAKPLFAQVGIPDELDEGYVALQSAADAKKFLETCAALRYWKRDSSVG